MRQSVQYRQPHCSSVKYDILCGKVPNIIVNLMKTSKCNYYVLAINSNHCFFRILTTSFQHPPLFLFKTVLFYNGAWNIHSGWFCL